MNSRPDGRNAEASELARRLMEDFVADTGLTGFAAPRRYLWTDAFRQPADLRLAFRELGLALGLHAVEGAAELLDREPARRAGVGERCDRRLATLLEMQGLAHIIEGFWADEKNRRSQSWRDHRDINTVMLAASLAPAGFLGA